MVIVHSINGVPWYLIIDSNTFVDLKAARKVISKEVKIIKLIYQKR
jgi:hypothetical protein